MFEKQYLYHIITFGCQMNKNDSERLGSILQSMGLEFTDDERKADVIFLNSCSVRESAEKRIYGKVRNFAKLREKKPDLIIGVTGCMPGRDKNEKLKKPLKDVDLYFPTREMFMLPKWLSELNPDLRPIDLEDDYLSIVPKNKNNFQVFVTIQTGCNHFCTYCVVPYARGTEGNRSLKSILDEINNLAQQGCLEITLLGQIINHYQAPDKEYFSKQNPYQKNDFAKLLWEINQIDGIKRIHWTAPHPIYTDEEVIDALTLPKQINFLHLPVQSGNDDILKKMNRRHDRQFYIDIIKRVRAKKSDIAIGTDIIVGFCGETEEEFQDTVDLYKECDFDISYNAKYSHRSGTAAAKAFEDDISKEEKKRRWRVLQKLMEEITYKKNQKYVGQDVEVLVESYEQGVCSGNSSEMKLVHFRGNEEFIGKVKKVQINRAHTWILWGTMV